MDSILLTIKAGLGVEPDYDGFDNEILMGINSSIFSLGQLGVGPEEPVTVTGIDETWDDLFDGVSNLEPCKSYILLNTRMIFDPPTTSYLLGAMERQILEIGWRIMVEVDPEVA